MGTPARSEHRQVLRTYPLYSNGTVRHRVPGRYRRETSSAGVDTYKCGSSLTRILRPRPSNITRAVPPASNVPVTLIAALRSQSQWKPLTALPELNRNPSVPRSMVVSTKVSPTLWILSTWTKPVVMVIGSADAVRVIPRQKAPTHATNTVDLVMAGSFLEGERAVQQAECPRAACGMIGRCAGSTGGGRR